MDLYKKCTAEPCFLVIDSTLASDYLDIVMPIYDFPKTSDSLQQYYRYERPLNNKGAIVDFPAGKINSVSFKFEAKYLGKDEIMAQKALK